MNDNNLPLPPLGLRPRWVCEESRTIEIIAAMRRYSEADVPIPIDWIDELDKLVDNMRFRDNNSHY